MSNPKCVYVQFYRKIKRCRPKMVVVCELSIVGIYVVLWRRCEVSFHTNRFKWNSNSIATRLMILFIIYESNEMEWVTQLHKIARHRMKESKHIPIVFVYFKYFWSDFISWDLIYAYWGSVIHSHNTDHPLIAIDSSKICLNKGI